MSKLPNRAQYPQEHANRIVAATIDVLRTRDALPLTDGQISERARNTVTAVEGAFVLVPYRLKESVEGFQEGTRGLRAAIDDVQTTLVTEGQR